MNPMQIKNATKTDFFTMRLPEVGTNHCQGRQVKRVFVHECGEEQLKYKTLVERTLAISDKTIQLSKDRLVTGPEFLAGFMRQHHLKPCDYFTAQFVITNALWRKDMEAMVKFINKFWVGLMVRVNGVQTTCDLDALLAINLIYKNHLEFFIRGVGLNPYDYFTADFILEAGRQKGKGWHHILIEEIKSFWCGMFEQSWFEAN